MTTQNLDLNKMGLTPLTEMEMQQVEGGNIFKAIANFISDLAMSLYNIFSDHL